MSAAVEVSCIIPTHGRPEFLAEALQSVLAQSAPVAEVIVVSDDANEQSREVVTAVASNSVIPVRWLDNPSGVGGASSSRNEGARVARGTLLAFLDDDDLWEPEYLQRALATKADADLVVTWLMMFRGDERTPGLQMREGLAAVEASAQNPGFTGSNFVVTAEAFWAIGGFDPELRVINDGDFIYRLLQHGVRYRVAAWFGVLQRKHDLGQLTAKTPMRAAGLRRYLEKHRATMRLRDRRYLRLMIYRTMFRVAPGAPAKLGYLVLGALNSSPASIWGSVTGWSKRKFWQTR